jgi:hypothetical protein
MSGAVGRADGIQPFDQGIVVETVQPTDQDANLTKPGCGGDDTTNTGV